MTLFTLTARERAALEGLAVATHQAEELRRAQALLWLDAGEDVPDVADRLLVSRQTVYNWAARFRQRSDRAPAGRLADGPRSGRPCTARGVIEPLLDAVLDADPRDWGYRATVWTAPLLTRYLREVQGVDVSRQSGSAALDRLAVQWKRPRHHLALRPATWRQSKGGSRVDCGTASGPSC